MIRNAILTVSIALMVFVLGPEVRAQTDHEYTRPGLGDRLAEPDIVAAIDGDPKQLEWHDDAWHVLTYDAKLYRFASGQSQLVAEGLPEGAQFGAWEGTLFVWNTDTLGRMDSGQFVPVVEGREGITGPGLHDGMLYWFEDAEGGSFVRVAPAGGTVEGTVEVVAKEMGKGNVFYPWQGGFLFGMAGDEPRGIKHLSARGATVESLVESRLVTRQFLEVDGTMYILMRNGTGFIKRFDPQTGALEQLNIAPSGSAGLHAHGGGIVWHTAYGIQRIDIETYDPEEVAMATRPVDMVVRDGVITWIDRHRRQILQLQ